MMFRHLTGRAAQQIRREAAAAARAHRHAGRRTDAWVAIEDGRQRGAAILKMTAYTIRHTD